MKEQEATGTMPHGGDGDAVEAREAEWDAALGFSAEAGKEAAAAGDAMTAEPESVEADALNDQELNEMIESICCSKAEEFHMLGYESVTGKDVWDCVSAQYKQIPPLHKIVNDILSLKPTKFMNWMTVKAYKGIDLD